MMEFIDEDREPADVTPDGKWECPRCYHDNQRDAAAMGLDVYRKFLELYPDEVSNGEN